jgi:hypothetical protein
MNLLIIVHSGITEIIASRLIENLGLINRPMFKWINPIVVTGRGYKPILLDKEICVEAPATEPHLPSVTLNTLPFDDWCKVQLVLNDFLTDLGIKQFVLACPHLGSTFARALVERRTCRGYIILEEGDFSYVRTKELEHLTKQYIPKLNPSKSQVERLKYAASNARKEIRTLFRIALYNWKYSPSLLLTRLFLLFNNVSFPTDIWQSYLKRKRLGFALCGKYSFPDKGINCSRLMLRKSSSREIQCISIIGSKFSRYSREDVILLLPSTSLLATTDGLNQWARLCSLLHRTLDSPNWRTILVRPHPDDLNQTLAELRCTFDLGLYDFCLDMELNRYPLELIVKAIPLPVVSCTRSSFFLYNHQT